MLIFINSSKRKVPRMVGSVWFRTLTFDLFPGVGVGVQFSISHQFSSTRILFCCHAPTGARHVLLVHGKGGRTEITEDWSGSDIY